MSYWGTMAPNRQDGLASTKKIADMVAADPELRKRLAAFYDRVVEEKAYTNPKWTGLSQNAIGASLTRHTAGSHIGAAVNELGTLHGCHTCTVKSATDTDQPWVGDHCPPTNLSAAVRAVTGTAIASGFGDLYPQCHKCSGQQSGLVNALNNGATYDPHIHDFLLGVRHYHNKSISATSEKVSPSEGAAIQNLGTQHGCHSCGTRYPAVQYDADHNPPVFMTFTHVITLMKLHDLAYEPEANYTFRPQCKKCSTNQGGVCSSIAREASELAKKLGIPVMRET